MIHLLSEECFRTGIPEQNRLWIFNLWEKTKNNWPVHLRHCENTCRPFVGTLGVTGGLLKHKQLGVELYKL